MEKEKLKEIVENTISGEWGTEEKKDENDIFVIRTADFFNDGRINYNNVIKRNIAKRKIEEKSLKIGDIIVEKSGGTDKNPVGRVVLFERENYKGLANNFTQVLRIKKEYYYKFIFYQLLYKYKNGSTLQMFNKTTGIQNLQMKLYLNQELNVCDKKEQIKISNLLDKVQKIIDFRKKQIQELDELIKSQFVEMFGNIKLNDKGWNVVDKIGNVCILNPKKSEIETIDNIEVSFIPMQSVSEKGDIDTSEIRLLNDVKKGFTYFKENDVLFAKITPCMENGKGAVAKGLKNNIGFGSTEFHVIRPTNKVNSTWLYTYTTFKSFRDEAERKMTGSAGQKRVPIKFFENYEIAIPPIDLQNKFADFVKQIDKQKFEVQKSLEEIQKLQVDLMNKYFG